MSDEERAKALSNLIPVPDAPVSVEFPTVEAFDPYIVQQMTELLATLRERGAAYGEKVLFERGEAGIFEQIATKLERVSGSIDRDLAFSTRSDSWLDIAGYAILVLAMKDWDGYLDPTRYTPETESPWSKK